MLTGVLSNTPASTTTRWVSAFSITGRRATKEQIEACQFLVRDLKTPLPKLRYVTSHACVAPGRAVDPSGFDFAHLAKFAELEIWVPEAALA